MKRVLCLLPAAILVLLGSITGIAQDAPKCTEANGLKSYEIKDILKAHKSARNGANISQLAWDCSVAAKAQAIADAAASGTAGAPEAGESRLSSHDDSLDVNVALEAWRQEKSDWDTKTAACETGHVCSHWAQMIAPATTKIGCGIARKGKGTSKAVLVCLYDPPRP